MKTKKKIEKTKTVEQYQCGSCDGSNVENLGEYPVQYHSGFTADGDRFTSIERLNVRCLDCGQRGVQRRFVFDPSNGKE